MLHRYEESEKLLTRALTTVPLGAQTFSKSHVQFPLGSAPFFLTRGEGSRVWDVDGNEYLDFVNALLAVSLGYNDPDVTAAVFDQLKQGVSFSLAHPIEMLLAEKMIAMIPCAEMVRFGKNGSDATAGAIRLARAYTGRDRVAVCGYHGWQDWYIGATTRNLGVPKATQDLTHRFIYNDLASLEKLFAEYPNEFAAVILEPMNIEYPQAGFLAAVKKITQQAGAILIFDEMITGFRFAKGGAQEYFGVTPDLAAFGKGMANGYPLSAIVGRKDLMKLMEDIFFSFTFGGETLSLAAALATLTKIETQPVLETLVTRGTQLQSGVQQLIKQHGLEKILSLSGHPSWSFLIFQATASYSPLQLKTFWMQEILARGILSFGTHNLSYAHSEQDIKTLLAVYDEVFFLLQQAVQQQDLLKRLRCKPLEPLFKVR